MFTSIFEFEEDRIWSGTIIRVSLKDKTEFYYTDKVFDIILFENYTEAMGLGALIINGAKAGKISFFFPEESYFDNSHYSINTHWLKENLFTLMNLSKKNANIFISKSNNIVPFDNS